MLNKFKKWFVTWIKERTTQVAICAIAIALCNKFAPDYSEVAIEIVAGLGLLVPDRMLGGRHGEAEELD